jgi:flagellin-like protein
MPIQDSNHRRMARNRSKEGISPVIATVILIAIAVVLGVAVASYAGGLFSTQSGTGGINVRLMSMKDDGTKLTGSLFIDNQGARADQIVSIEIPGLGTIDDAANIGVDTDNNGCNESSDPETIPANTTNLAACFEDDGLDNKLEPGQTVTVRISLRSGTVITQSVTVQGP